jgi:hypothetical protein
MTYTVVCNWGWYDHDDCRNAYSVHNSDCKITKRISSNVQGIWDDKFATIENAIEGCIDDAEGRFTETLAKFGFWQMVKVCKCAGGATTKKIAKQTVKVGN